MSMEDAWFVVGISPACAISPDATTWIHVTLPGEMGIAQCIAYGDGQWVIGATGLWTSLDGITWTQRATALDPLDIVWTGSRFIAVGSGDTDTIIVISDDGITWTSIGTPIDGDGNNLVSIDGTGDTWVAGLHFADPTIGGLITTDSGSSWSTFTIPGAYTAEIVCHGPDGWIATASDDFGAGGLLSSPDGSAWNIVTLDPIYRDAGTVGYIDGQYVVQINRHTPFDDTVFLTSADLSTWDGDPSPGPTFIPRRMITANGVMFGFSEVLSGLYKSTDGSTWHLAHSGFAPFGIGYGPYGAIPPQRQFPRDDGLGISTRRSWPPNVSKQHGLRRGTTNTYQ